MKDFVFITDLHIKASSAVRNGDLMDDLATKLSWVADYCNDNDAVLLIGGDVFDKPSVQDYVKNRFVPILRSVKCGVYGICGNHDRLYDNPAYNYKTSWATLTTSGVIKDVDVADVDFGDAVVSSILPVEEKGKPCIFMFHGFLNLEDGRNTFRFTDINEHKSKTIILLGHDHKVYEPMVYDNNTTIIRPGAFQRATRSRDISVRRQPCLVHIRVDGDNLSYNVIEIASARSYDSIFDTQEETVSRAEVHASYEDVISQISNASKTQLTFGEALESCGTPDVVEYLKKLLDEVKYNNSLKKQNL